MDVTGLVGFWELIQPAAGESLREARLQAHWAAQLPAAVARALAPARADDSHTSLSWLREPRMLVGEHVAGRVRTALALADLRICLLDADDRAVETLPLEGHLLEDALGWLADRFQARSGLRPRLKLPDYEMPAHPVGDGRPFAVDGASLAQLASWYANAAPLFEAVRKAWPGAAPVRCWPHHFDIATLIALDRGDGAAEQGRSIGAGMSPGDGSYDEPYFYVTPWPHPEGKPLPELQGGGAWHTEGWVGAVLPSSRIAAAGVADQVLQVSAFLQSALAAARELI